MIEITETEAKAYQAFLKAGNIPGVARLTNRTMDHVRRRLLRLTEAGLLEKIALGLYISTRKQYVIKQRERPGPKERKKRDVEILEKLEKLSNLIPPHVTEEQKLYIAGHYNTMPRSKLALKTGLSKVDLNNTIMGLDLRKEGNTDANENRSA